MSEHYPTLPQRGEHEEFESSQDLPSKNRKAFKRFIQDPNEKLVQVETKSGLAWTEPEPKAREPSAKRSISPAVDSGPSVQVETKSGFLSQTQPSEVVPAVGAEPIAQPQEIALATGVGPVQTKEQIDSAEKVQSLTTEEVKHMLEDQLKNNPDVLNITNVKVDEEDGGLRLNVGITTSGGKAIITGLVVNEGNGLAMSDLDVDANLFIRGRVKNAFADFSSAIKSRLEQRYGKTISNIQIGKSGVAIEFEVPVAGTAPDDKIEPTIRSVPEQQDDRVDFMARQADLLDELNAKYPEGIPQHIHKELLDLGSRYIGNRESGADPSVEAQIRADRESFMASEGVQFVIEGYQSFENRKKFLNGRNNELGTKAKEYGIKFAKFIGKQAESYNKLKWYNKLLITGGLMTVASLTSAIPIVSGLAATALYGQRALGSVGFFMNRRREIDAKIKANPKHWLANKSELEKNLLVGTFALAYMEATSIAAHAGVAELNKLGVNEWLGNMLGYNTAPPTSGSIPVPHATVGNSAFQLPVAETPPAAEVATPKVDAAVIPETVVSAPTVEAATEQTPRELRVKLNSLVEKITEITEEKPPSFEMPKHADFSIHEDDTTISPYDVTPTDQSGEDDMLSTAEEIEEQAQPAETVTETTRSMPIQPESPTETPETSAPTTEPEEIVLQQPTEPPTIDLTTVQTSAEMPTPTQEIVTNSFGLEVTTTESHLYSGSGDRLYVFGGTTADHSKTIREFFSEPENAKKILYTPPVTGGSHVIGWIKSPDGAIMSTGPLEAEERNWFGMKKYVEKIELDMLRKKIN